MQREDSNPASCILQRLQAEEAFRESKRNKHRSRASVYVRTVWTQRAFLVRLSGLGLVLGVLAAFLIPARYTSTARLMPPDNPSGASHSMATSLAASRGDSGFGQIATDLLGLNGTSEIFVGLLRSRTVQNKIIDQFELKSVYGSSHLDDIRARLSKRVAISVDRKNQIITISVTDGSRNRAQGMAQAYLDQLNRLVTELSTSSARRERIFLESRLEQVNQSLETAEREFSQFASKEGTIDINEQGRAMVDAAATVQGQLMFARSELEEMRQIYTDSNARVRGVRARIAELESQLEKFGGKGQANTRGSESDAAPLYPSFRKLPLLGVTHADLYRRTKVQEAVYAALTQEYELAKVQEAREIPTVKVLDPPDMPDKKGFPPGPLILGSSSMFLAGVTGLGFLFVSKSWRERDSHDPGKVVVTEILIDLKEKRFLNSVNCDSHDTEGDPVDAPRRRRGVFSFLGYNDTIQNGNGSHPSHCLSGEERFEE